MRNFRAIPKSWFIAITVSLIIIKSLIGAMEFHYVEDKLQYKLQFKKDFSVQYSGDEFEIVKSGFYYNKYGQIMTDSPFHSFAKPRVRPAGLYLTAFRPKAQVLLHAAGLRIAESIKGKRFERVSDIPANYLHCFGVFMFILKTLMFPVSVLFFFRILTVLNLRTFLVQTGTWLYILIPSVFLFIGWFDTWENYSLYSFIVVFYYVLAETLNLPGSSRRYYTVPVLVMTSALARPHLIIFYIALFSFLFFFSLLRSSKKLTGAKASFSRLSLVVLICLEVAHIPIFLQNHRYFGQYVLSTQSKFEFFQGHNMFARGSWYPGVYTNNKAYFDSVFKAQPMTGTSELKEGEYYQKMAVNWIRSNPGKEVVLDARKVAGYFIPWNFINHRINIYTLLLHLAFFAFAVRFFVKTFVRRNMRQWEVYFLVMIPALMSLLLTVTFFTGERWRYFAEPFFLIMGLLLANRYLKDDSQKEQCRRFEAVPAGVVKKKRRFLAKESSTVE